ncbi:hypothetical protein BTVI_114940 [Pitangus sulphuratus]|nr:hypothetical protein BTVI_114940 [Pitangus sulphuratus]
MISLTQILCQTRELIMSSEQGAKKRHHNPVDSICRKIRSIQMMDQVSNPALQIPKFQSRSFDSPQCNVRKNLEEILKGRTFRSCDGTSPTLISPSNDGVFSANSSPSLGPLSDSSAAGATFTVVKSNERSSNPWAPGCLMEDCSPFCFGPQEAHAPNKPRALSKLESKDVRRKQNYLTSSPNLYFFTSERKPDSAGVQPPLPKAFPLSERGGTQIPEFKSDDVSLISEEDLLTTIFWACDTEHTGKVAVSKIVDYLRHTTSRGSEDSGLEELCNMLDPDQKDISMDLETYHAVMGEWIEDRKRKWEDSATGESSASMEDLELPAPKNISEAKKTHARMNVTSGSLEAFGGDVSKGDMETSDLITCVADLQYKTHKLQEENNKLKLTLEAVDETSSKLLADNEHLHQQIKSIQHYVLKVKSLEEELEDARNNLNLSEEKRVQVLWQNKQLIQVNLYESTVVNKEASLVQKEQDIKELKLTIVECSSIIEMLRAEKNKLLENMQHMQQELISNGLCFPLLCKYNSDVPEGMNSLHCELELAQSSEQEEASEVEELVMASLEWVKDPEGDTQQTWESKLVNKPDMLEIWCMELNKGCLVMEEKSPKGLREGEEDVPTSAGTEKNSDKDAAGPVSGPLKKEFCPVLEEHKPAPPNVLKQEPEVGQDKKNNKEQGEEAPAVAPSRKGSSPSAGGIKGDKTKQNEPESPSEKEVEAEFLRLSLGFKCDLFTLDKRVRLEERSRDLAEENLKKEITNAVKMLEPSSALRRVSIATVPRSAGNAGIGLPLAQLHDPDGDERSERFNRRSSSWGKLGAKQNEKRPSLQRFLSTYSWAEYEEEHFATKNEQSESPAEAQEQPSRKESVSEKGKYSSKWTLESVCNLMSSWASHFKASFSNANKTLWVSVSILVLLAALTSFLTGLSLQRPADAAPVGTGDSWTSLQQLLWPYTRLQHNGPPPV